MSTLIATNKPGLRDKLDQIVYDRLFRQPWAESEMLDNNPMSWYVE